MKKRLLTLLVAGTLLQSNIWESLPYSKEYSKDSKIENKIEIFNSKKVYENKPLSKNEVNEILSEIEISNKYFPKKTLEKMTLKESSRNPWKNNEKSKAKEILQIKKETWKEINPEVPYKTNWYNPKQNIQTGIKYLNWLKNAISKNNPKWETISHEEKKGQIIVGYNWGYGNLMKSGWNPEKFPKETRDYIKFVLGEMGRKDI